MKNSCKFWRAVWQAKSKTWHAKMKNWHAFGTLTRLLARWHVSTLAHKYEKLTRFLQLGIGHVAKQTTLTRMTRMARDLTNSNQTKKPQKNREFLLSQNTCITLHQDKSLSCPDQETKCQNTYQI